MRNITLIFALVMSLCGFAQEQKMVTIKTDVSNFNNDAREGEQILFESQNTGKTYKGISDASGKFSIQLPGPDKYQIKIKGVGMEQDYQEMEIPKLQPNQTYGTFELTIKFDPPKIFTLNNVYFDTGKATIRHKSSDQLNELKEYLELKPDIRVEIAGHTDKVGSDESNMSLSQRRAEAVRNWLVHRGIDGDRIEAKGYGETQSIASNNTAEGRQKNRRVEVRILDEE
ncbi:MAG: OmpA family protein [Bacteroidota bacterium]|nr:OmpA family protein [Bacteroidota bacterium]